MAITQGMQMEKCCEDKSQMTKLTAYGLIEVAGEDAKGFLLSLATSDVKQVSPAYSQFSAICDTKGRVLASFLIINRGDAYYLFLPKDMVEQVIKKLRMHVLRSKVMISDHSDKFELVGLTGDQVVRQCLQHALDLQPPTETPGQTVHNGDYTLIKMPGQAPSRWLVMAGHQSMAELWGKLLDDVVPIDKDAWSALDAASGVPFIVPDTAGEYLPQMLNMEAMGGLSFTKGCYPGQEVIARLHYRGKLKRRLFVATTKASELPAAGTRLYHPGSPDCIGHVLSAARHANGQVVLQAVIEIEQQCQGEVALAYPDGATLLFMREN